MADYISQFTGGEIDRRLAKVSELEAGKQDKLASGENIKTIGGQSVLGEGNIPLTDQEAVKFTPQSLTDAQKAQALANIGAASEDEVVALADQKYEGPYESAAALPTASASTMGAIYLVGPDSNGEYDRYVTKVDGSTYTWGSLGKTSIDLSNYATKAEVGELEAEKVDKVTGKSLIDANVAESINFIQNQEWIDIKTDSESKILEGTKTDGTKVIESPLELQGVRQETIYNPEFIQVITDAEGKVIEVTKKDGKKVFYGGVEGVDSIQSVNISLLDANFTSPIPCVITGTKGSETAKYDFETSLGKDSFNIRIKFRVTDNLLNRETTAQVLKLGNVIINAIPTPLSQFSTSEIYNEQPVTMLWPDFNGGIKYGVSTQYKLGQYAFYIKYIGSEDSASVENNGTKLTLKSGSTTTEFPFSTYSTVSSLYNALKALSDIEVDFKEVEGRTTDELALFPECQLKLTCYTRTGGSEQGEIEEYVDTPPFFIPYAVDDSWHQVEIVKIGTFIYCACDGATQIIPYDNSIDYSTLTLGDGNKMLFKDLNINLKSADDAEFYANGSRIVSSVNPAIIIFEGHGMYDGIIDSEAPDQLTTSIDRLYYVFGKMQSMGYVPVSINDIAEYYAGNKDLPKRCYSIVFDDFRWENCLNAKYRKVFKELCVYPALAIITDRDVAITHNGENITKKEAAEICLRNGFGLLSHTRNHWKLDSVRLSTLISECMQDIYSADDCLVDGMILVYPGGRNTKYSISTLKWLGYSLGIGIAKADNNYASNQKDTNKYALIRVEIGVRTTLDIILNKII